MNNKLVLLCCMAFVGLCTVFTGQAAAKNFRLVPVLLHEVHIAEQNIITGNSVQLLAFNAETSENGIVVYWITEAKSDIEYYIVERSFNGTDFLKISQVPVLSYSGKLLNYEVIDPMPGEGDTFYRLIPVDANGIQKKSTMIRLPYEVRLASDDS